MIIFAYWLRGLDSLKVGHTKPIASGFKLDKTHLFYNKFTNLKWFDKRYFFTFTNKQTFDTFLKMLYFILILLNFIFKGSIPVSCCCFLILIVILKFFFYGFIAMNYSSYQLIDFKFFSFTADINYCIGFSGLNFIMFICLFLFIIYHKNK